VGKYLMNSAFLKINAPVPFNTWEKYQKMKKPLDGLKMIST